MSSASVTSSKREKTVSDLKQELEAVCALNASLRVHLEILQTLMRDVRAVNDNCKQLVWMEDVKEFIYMGSKFTKDGTCDIILKGE